MSSQLLKNRRFGAVFVALVVLACPWCVDNALHMEKTAAALQDLSREQTESTREFLCENFMDVSDYSQLRFDEETGVCSFESSASTEETLEAISQELEAQAWVQCSFNAATNASFYRDYGVYTSAYVMCVRVQETTVVVCNLM